MKKIFLFTGLAFILWISAWAQTIEVDALIKPYVQTNNFSGSIWVSQNAKTIFSKAYGQMNRSYNLPNTIQTKFYLASVSMIFTSAAIMKLVEEKKLSLEDPLSKYLPDYKYGNRISLHNLMSQRSGIPPIGQNKKVDYDSITKFGHTCDKLIDYFKDDDLLFEPNSKYNHGRSDYILLAYIIEKVTGKSFGTYLKETIFDPLKMTNTGHSIGEKKIVPNLAVGYAPVGHYEVENAYQIDWTSKTGHGSIYSTAEDLNKFAIAILNNTFLSKESCQKIFTNYGDQVGYAWFIREHLDKKRFQMNGRSPGFSSYFAIYPDDKLVIVVLSNNYISLPPEIGKQVATLVFKKPITYTKLTMHKLSTTQAIRLTGKYKFDEKFYKPNFEMEISYKEGNLLASWGALIPIDNGKLNFNKFILRDYWSDIEFIENSKGEVEAMLYDGHKGIKTNVVTQSTVNIRQKDKVYAFVKGKWFDGKLFVPKNFYAQDGILISSTPSHVDSVIDLTGKYVIPPFGEAHNHNVEWYGEERFFKLRDKYLKDGIYYVKNPNNLLRTVTPLYDKINIPESIDVAFANGSFTASGGHPMEIVKRNIDRKIWTAADGEGAFFYAIDKPIDFTNKWNLLKETKPDFIKTYLLYSEEFKKRENDTAYFGWKGLNPSILKTIVKKIQKDGYRVSTHVETATDFHNALVAGVDEINHTPGFRADPKYGFDKYKIADEDAQLARKNKTIVVTTMGGAIDYIFKTIDTMPSSSKYKEMIIHNFNVLQKNKVQIAIGTDIYGQNSRYEMANIARLNIFDNITLLKMWCEITAKTIFPQRKIGYLKEGYEANFLVLDGDPIQDFKNIDKIIMSIKSGVILPPF